MTKKQFLRIVFLLLCGSLSGAWLDLAVRPSAAGGLFSDQEALTFQVSLDAPSLYRVFDLNGTIAATGKLPISGNITLPNLPRGYYRMEVITPNVIYQGQRTFAVTPPQSSAEQRMNSPFAIDTGISSRPIAAPQSGEWGISRPEMIEIIARSGFANQRDRTGWCEKSPGQYQLESKRLVAAELQASGIATTGMIEGPVAPYLRNRKSSIPHRPMVNGVFSHLAFHQVEDLRLIYNYCRELARQCPQMRYCEYGNEPENRSDTIWELACSTKVAYLGFKAGNPKLSVLSCSFCLASLPYMRSWFQNETASYFDIFNFHCYRFFPEMAAYVGKYKSILKEFNTADRSCFVTEIGSVSEEEFPANSSSKRKPGTIEATPLQELLTAEFNLKAQLKMLELGVNRSYTFYLPSYHEKKGRKDWGQIRPDGSAKPSLAGFAALNHFVGDARYLGLYPLADDVTGYLFAKPDGSQTLVYWKISLLERLNRPLRSKEFRSNDTIERTYTLPVAAQTYLNYNWLGHPYPPAVVHNRQATLHHGVLPSYLIGLRGLKPKHPAVLGQNEQAAESAIVDRTIVGRLIPRHGFEISGMGTFGILKKKSATLTVELYNFSDHPKRGYIHISGVKISTLPQNIELAPMERKQWELTVEPLPHKIQTELILSGSFNEKTITRCVIPLYMECQLDTRNLTPLPRADRPEGWRANSSDTLKKVLPGAENGVDFPFQFPHGQRWIYPEYLLQENESLSDAVGFEFEFRAQTQRPVSRGIVYLVPTNIQETGGEMIHFSLDGSTEWQKCVVIAMLPETTMRTIKLLRIGCNPPCENGTISIRNLKIIRKRTVKAII